MNQIILLVVIKAYQNVLCAIYLQIACLPPEFYSKLENVFLFVLFNSLDKKNLTNKIIFSKAIKELKFLETEGINIIQQHEVYKIYFSLTLILDDNLGLNSILRFNECFSAKIFCRFCLIPYNNINNIIDERDCELRTEENYESRVKTQNPSLTGIKETCIFNKLQGYHVLHNKKC